MTLKSSSPVACLSAFALFWSFDYCTKGQTSSNLDQTPPPAIKTNFVSEAILSATELNQVLMLAKMWGISNAAEVRTFHGSQLVGDRGISVKSVDRIKGRDSYFDTLLIYKIGWSRAVPPQTASRFGDFWAAGGMYNTTHVRSYRLNDETIRLSIGKNVEIAFADEAMALIAEKKVRFLDEIFRRKFEKLRPLRPVSIDRADSQNALPTYEIFLDGSEPSLMIVLIDKNELVVTGWGGGPMH